MAVERGEERDEARHVAMRMREQHRIGIKRAVAQDPADPVPEVRRVPDQPFRDGEFDTVAIAERAGRECRRRPHEQLQQLTKR